MKLAKPPKLTHPALMFAIILIICIYLYAIPASIVQLTAAGYPFWLALILSPITSTFALFLAILLIGTPAYVGLALGCLIIAIVHHSAIRKKP